MIYSGANLIQAHKDQQDRVERLKVVPTEPVPSVAASTDLKDALSRFARFVNKDKKPPAQKKAKRPPLKNPYARQLETWDHHDGRGFYLDIHV